MNAAPQFADEVHRLPSMVGAFVVASIIYASAVIIYRLTFHPLARYPGPILGRITDWYSVYYAWKGDRHLQFYNAHQKYGDFVRYGPNRMSVNSTAALKAIYGTKANTQKSQFYSVFNHFFTSESTETVIDKTQHARKKRVLSQALSDRALKAMEGSLLGNVRKFCDHLMAMDELQNADLLTNENVNEKWSATKNIAKWTDYLAFDVMGNICFGETMHMMDKEDNRYMIEIISDGSQGLNVVGHMPLLLKLKLDQLLFRKLVKGLEMYEAYSKAQADKRIKRHVEGDTDAGDVFGLLLRTKNPDSQEPFETFGTSELISESSLLIIAGSHTSAMAMSATIFYLLQNSEACGKLKDEIRTNFSEVEEIRSGYTLSSCHYLRACIDEAMRLSPPVGGLMPREVCSGGLDIDGHHFLPGTDIGASHYTIHHNEAYYPDPFAYKPDRWLVDEKNGVTAASVLLAQSNFCTFSFGSRGCAGKGMAYMEMTIVLARVVWLFDMRLAQSGARSGKPMGFVTREGEYPTYDKFVSEVDGPLVDFRAR